MFFKALSVRNILLFLTLASTFAYQALAHDAYFQDDEGHIFSSGEQIHISVLHEDDLTNDYDIDDAGLILMPLIGKVHVAGMRASEIEELLSKHLRDGYILEPVISVYAIQKGGFYILGEVNNPGRYDVPDENLNILKAVALAGGFTYRANKREFEIVRSKGKEKQHTENNSVDAKLLSGDIIIVKERFF